jgi:maleylacetate reductase
MDFVYAAPAARVIFGAGSLAQLPREIELLGVRKALVLCTPEQSSEGERLVQALAGVAAGLFAGVAPHGHIRPRAHINGSVAIIDGG